MNPPLQGLQLINFRNFQQHQETFTNQHTLFKGQNAVGKTNLLEAISFLCPGTGFRKESLQNFSHHDNAEQSSSIIFKFFHEELNNELKIDIDITEKRWSKNYYLNEKKISQQQLLNIFQLFWFTEVDKVFFIKDTQYQRNTINRIICYFNSHLFKLLNTYTKLRREKKKVLQSSPNQAWLESLDSQLMEAGQSILEIKIKFLNAFQSFMLEEDNTFFQFDIEPSMAFLDQETFLKQFEQGLKDENKWPTDYRLKSESDPLKSVFEISHAGKKISQLSSAQSKLLILSFLLHCAKFLNENKITIFLIDEIFDNFDMMNIEKVIQYCAENNFQTFFSTTDNFSLQGSINNLEIKEIK